ncbi:hypothetical protein MTR67_017947 [Solanum verrucosum]|uniref:Uncharacterized protein n=1 Tax=Solanum verrucosum TaxID=315347 RepID=A0AAF0TL64_SOLVR|nr:hypothetical protein MTR67_017947 [Solanum verrucosum]
MTQNSSCRKRSNILITRTPSTRKMTTAASLAVVTELCHINVGDFANEEKLTNDWDDTFDCYYINEDLVSLYRFLDFIFFYQLPYFCSSFELLWSLIQKML